MKCEAMIVQDSHEVWFKGEKDEKAVRNFTMLDAEASDDPMKETFDYRPTVEEATSIPIRSLIGKVVVIAVRKIQTQKGGRHVFQGRIVSGLNGGTVSKVKSGSPAS